MNFIDQKYDCLIIGGGPAGLTSAEYLGRFLRKVAIVDSGHSRAQLIPTAHNYPGFGKGISGSDFLTRLRDQVQKYQVNTYADEVTSLYPDEQNGFVAVCKNSTYFAKTVILATGMVDEKPELPNIMEFIYDGIVRFCPICDGYEALDKKIGLIGPCQKLYKKACFLRTYTPHIDLFPIDSDFECDPESRKHLQSLNVHLPDKKVIDIKLSAQGAIGKFEDGSVKEVDLLYPVMGAEVRTGFAKSLNIRMSDSGCIYTDAHQQTNVTGVYAIGDITLDLSQISVAIGQAAIAATAVHNSLPINCRGF